VLGLQRPVQNHQNFEKFPEINTQFPKSASVITQVFLSGCGLHRLKKSRKITSSDPERSSGSGIFADRMALILAGSRMSGRFHTLPSSTQAALNTRVPSRVFLGICISGFHETKCKLRMIGSSTITGRLSAWPVPYGMGVAGLYSQMIKGGRRQKRKACNPTQPQGSASAHPPTKG
jgi:hypothetical protein